MCRKENITLNPDNFKISRTIEVGGFERGWQHDEEEVTIDQSLAWKGLEEYPDQACEIFVVSKDLKVWEDEASADAVALKKSNSKRMSGLLYLFALRFIIHIKQWVNISMLNAQLERL